MDPQWWTCPARIHSTSPGSREYSVKSTVWVAAPPSMCISRSKSRRCAVRNSWCPPRPRMPLRVFTSMSPTPGAGGRNRTRRMGACPVSTIAPPLMTVRIRAGGPRFTAMTNLTYTVLDAADASLNKTSVLVTGETEAVVVDAAFTRADGHRIVAEVLDSGKRLTTVVITAGDPDFYFGAE